MAQPAGENAKSQLALARAIEFDILDIEMAQLAEHGCFHCEILPWMMPGRKAGLSLNLFCR